MQINSSKFDREADPIVTIITVAYNADNSIERTIQNIIGQTYSNIEYIIIDGGSTDSTVDIIKSYEDNISYWVSEPDNGIYFAMNKAIDIAVGTWVNFMNAGDTFIDDNVIKNFVNQTSDDTDIYYGSRYICTGDNVVFEECLHLDNIYYKMPFGHQAAFIKSAILKKLRFDTSYKLSADYDFFIRCYRENCTFHDLGFPVCNFHTGGLSYQQHLKSTVETLKILSDYTDEEDIKKSLFYKNFIKKVMQEELQNKDKIIQEAQEAIVQKDIQIAERQEVINQSNKQLENIKLSIYKITEVSTVFNPIQKIAAYKEMLKLYHKIKKEKT